MAVDGRMHPGDQNSRNDLGNLGRLYLRLGKLAESEAATAQLLDLQLKTFGPEHLNPLVSAANRAYLQWKQGKRVEAEATLRPALPLFEKVAPNSYERHSAQTLLYAITADQTRYADSMNAMSQRQPTGNITASFFSLDEAKSALPLK